MLSLWLPLTSVKAADSTTENDFVYTQDASGITITGYTGSEKIIKIPTKIAEKNVVKIATNAFKGKGLTGVLFEVDSQLIEIGTAAFANNTLATIQLPENLKFLGESSFENNAITEVHIPKTLVSIGNRAFYTNKITQINFPADGVLETIGSFAFSINQISTLTIPNSVKAVQTGAFQKNVLTEVTLPQNSDFISIGAAAFANNQLTMIHIPKSVKQVEDNAFNTNQLTSVTFEAGSALTSIGVHGFANNELTAIILPETLKNIAELAFLNNQLTTVDFGANPTLQHIQQYAFATNKLTSFDLPKSVISIGHYAFTHNKLKSFKVTADSALTSLGQYAFEGNPLETFKLEKAVTTVDGNVLKSLLKTGYTFEGIYENGEAFDNDFTGPLSLVIKWTPVKQAVTFNTKGGSSVASVEVDYDAKLSKPTDPTKTGYTFTGWYTDEATQNAYDFDAVVTKPFTLYAKWTQNSSGGGIISPPAKPTTPAPSIKPPTDDEKKLTGTTVPNAIITIKINEAVYTIQADNHGFYTFDYSILQAGQRIEITATAPNGVVSSTVVAYVKDKTPPALKHTVVSDKSTKVTITSEPHTRIYLYENNRMIDADFTDEKGRYTAPIEKMRAGTLVKLEVVNRAGNRTVKTWTVLDRTAPTKPKMTIKKGVLSGKTEKNATITIKKGSKVIKTIKTKDGKFSMKLSKGTYSMTFTDAAKNKSKVYKLTVS